MRRWIFPVAELCGTLGVPFTFRETQLGRLSLRSGRRRTPAPSAQKWPRALHGVVGELGIKKIALAHHYDDAVETFLLSLLYEGRITCFQPVTFMSRTGVAQIRPLLYIGEGTIRSLVNRYHLPVVENVCPMNGKSKREEVKTLLRSLSAQYPDLKSKIFGAMQRLPLEGWEPAEYARRPLP